VGVRDQRGHRHDVLRGAAGQYIENPRSTQVLCILLAGANVLYLTLFDEVWALGPGDNAPTSAKLVAASQVFLWSA